jgi:feruloyl esterase
MLSRAQMRIQEKPLRNWVPPAKGNAVLAEFMRRCDKLDGLADGIINDYFDCRAIFNVKDGIGEKDPWGPKRCPNDVDPDPADASQDACLTSGQIETLQVFFSSIDADAKLANGRTNFGMWAPTTAVGNAATLSGAAAAATPAARAGGAAAGGGRGAGPMVGGMPGGGFLAAQRFRGQEGAAPDAPSFNNQGTIGVVGFVMQDLDANPIDYDVRRHRARREQLSQWLDSTDPDFSAFRKRGGKLLVTVGTDDTTASSGEQQNFYQTVLDRMGRKTVDSFARLYVVPQGGHGLSGRAAPINGDGQRAEPLQVASNADRFGLLQAWVEKGVAPGRSVEVTAGTRSMPMCSYPEYPHYKGGDLNQAASYACTAPASLKK